MHGRIKTAPLNPHYEVPITTPVGICIPVFNAVNNENLAQVQFGIEQCVDLPYQISMGVGPNCVAKNRIKAEARLHPSIEYVIHMDDDVVVPPHFASKLVSVLMQNHESIGVVSAVMIGPRGQSQNDVNPNHIGYGTVQDCVPPGTFFAYNRKRTPIEWDTEYKGSQFEDTDAMMQVRAQRYRTVATGNVLIMHKNNWSENKWWNDNKARFMSKWPGVVK